MSDSSKSEGGATDLLDLSVLDPAMSLFLNQTLQATKHEEAAAVLLDLMSRIEDVVRGDERGERSTQWFREQIAKMIGCKNPRPESWLNASIEQLERSTAVVRFLADVVTDAKSEGELTGGWYALEVGCKSLRRFHGDIAKADSHLRMNRPYGDAGNVTTVLEQLATGNKGSAVELLRNATVDHPTHTDIVSPPATFKTTVAWFFLALIGALAALLGGESTIGALVVCAAVAVASLGFLRVNW